MSSSVSSGSGGATSQQRSGTSTIDEKPLPEPPRTLGWRWDACVRSCRRWVLNTWLGEVAAILFSAACLIAMTVILRIFDEQPIPSLPYSLTLNAIVSILATGAKSTLILAVAGCMSQLKWAWFTQKSRKLEDMQIFDDASRGPWGSIMMLFSTNAKSLASIGALVTVLALAFDPFVQQIVTYPARFLTSPDTGVATTKASTFNIDTTAPEFVNAINAGVWSDMSTFERSPSCPSGNCNWPPFRSVGWCSTCENITHSARIEDCDFESYSKSKTNSIQCNITIPYGSGTTVVRGHATRSGNETEHPFQFASQVTWAINSTINEMLGDLGGYNFLGVKDPALVLGYASVTIQRTQSDVLRAEQCVLTPCARTYDLSMVNGKVDASVVETNYGLTKYNTVPDPVHNGIPDPTTTVLCWQADPGNLTFNWTGAYQNYIQFYSSSWASTTDIGFCPLSEYQSSLIGALTGNATTSTDGIDDFELTQGGNYYNWLETNPYNGGAFGATYSSTTLQRIVSTNLTYVVGNVAASLTKLALDLSNETVAGNSTTSEVYVSVEWQWILLPAALDVLGIILLLATIFLSHRHRVSLWKTSVLAYLYHGLDDSILQSRTICRDVNGMEDSARRTLVSLGAGSVEEGRILLGRGSLEHKS